MLKPALMLLLAIVSVAMLVAASEDVPADAEGWIAFMRDGDANHRREAREALVALGTAAVPVLVDATRDAFGFIRWEAVNALGVLAAEDPQAASAAIPALIDRAASDPDPHPRWRSLWALGVFPRDEREGEIIPGLWAWFDAEAEADVHWYATVALAFFGEGGVAGELNEGVARANAFERWEAVYCLRFVHDERSVDVLCGVLGDEGAGETALRQEAALTLARIGDPAAIPALTAALCDAEGAVRWRAASGLAQIAGVSALPEIAAAFARETDPIALASLERIVRGLQEAAGTAHDGEGEA